jgi:nicotinamide-nucleotide amidase
MSPYDVNRAAEIAQWLRERHWKLAVAESITAGHLQALVTSISGASDYFVGGITVYDLDRKVELLGVDARLAFACNGVSAEVVEQMARGAIRLFRTECALATTGYAEPSASWNVTTPFAFCCAALATGADTIHYRTERFEFRGDRVDVQHFIATCALDLFKRTSASFSGE